jgi:hypothetical protein
VSDLVHIKDSATQDRPLCGYEPGDAPMAWTGRLSADKMATCPECVQEYLMDKCSICDGNGSWQEYGETVLCQHCSLDAAEDFITRRLGP